LTPTKDEESFNSLKLSDEGFGILPEMSYFMNEPAKIPKFISPLSRQPSLNLVNPQTSSIKRPTRSRLPSFEVEGDDLLLPTPT